MRRAVAAGRRTYLRKPTGADADEVVDRVRASRDHLLPWVHGPDSPAAYAQWLQRGERADCEQFLVCARDDDAVAGFVNLNVIVRGAMQQASAGWASFLPHVGAGHLTAGVALALEVAFTQLRLHRVEANIQPGNTASRTLAVRSGFRLEGYSPGLLQVGGEWCDHERWAVLEPEWRDRRRRDRGEVPAG